jgi:putative endonuclease
VSKGGINIYSYLLKSPSDLDCGKDPRFATFIGEGGTMFKGAWVYILQCCDGSYYVGCTTAIEQRLRQHELGAFPGYTSMRRPVALVWCAEFPDIFQAIAVERQIKGWSRRKKEALIQGDFDLLHELAECKNATNSSNYPSGSEKSTNDSLRLRSD